MPQVSLMKRTRIIVAKDFQYRFARFVILFAFGTALVTATTVFFTTFSLLGDKLAQVYPQGRLLAVFRNVYLAFGINLIVLAPIVFYVCNLFSHRIVGPLPKIYAVLKKVGQGDLDQKVVLRKDDELRDLAEAINDMIDGLKKNRTQ